MSEYKRVVYVVFHTVTKSRWWNWLLHKNINHCYFIIHIRDNVCLMINQTEGGMEMNVYGCSAYDLIESAAKNGAIDILSHVCKGSDLGNPKMKFLRTCVGLCKDAMGISAFRVFTPYQLYKYMGGTRS